jgi:DNA polymerase-3 subunit delta
VRIDPRRLAAFLRDPGGCRVALLFGDDLGLIRTRADALVRAVAGDLHDPFRVTELGRDAIGALADEAAAGALTGGRRVVRAREVTDTATPAVRAVLEGASDGFVILEAPGLATRSKLAALVEADARGGVIRCFPVEGRDLEATIEAAMGEYGVTIERDALRWVAERLPADHAAIRHEAGKLALYAGAGGGIDLAAAAACLDDRADRMLDEALLAATLGDPVRCDEGVESALAGGQTAVAAIRAALSHVHQLLRARQAVDAGASVEEAVSRLRPPVFWKSQPGFRRALGGWTAARLNHAALALARAELACKRTGAPADAICRRALLDIAVTAARLREPGARR